MRLARVLVLLPLAAAWSVSAADRDPAIRVFVRVAEGDTAGAPESATDVRQILGRQERDSVLTLASTEGAADLVLWMTGRHSTVNRARGVSPAEQSLAYVVKGLVVEGGRSWPISGASLIWREAAVRLIDGLAEHAQEQQHALLRKRPDWPDAGFEFESLTKERKKQFGAKDGAVVVTSVRPEGPAEAAGLRVGDAILSLDEKKLKTAAELARAVYASMPGTPLRLELTQRGVRRRVTLAVP